MSTAIIRERLGHSVLSMVERFTAGTQMIDKQNLGQQDLPKLRLTERHLSRAVEMVEAHIRRWEDVMRDIPKEDVQREQELFGQIQTFTDHLHPEDQPPWTVTSFLQRAQDVLELLEDARKEIELGLTEQSTQSGQESPSHGSEARNGEQEQQTDDAHQIEAMMARLRDRSMTQAAVTQTTAVYTTSLPRTNPIVSARPFDWQAYAGQASAPVDAWTPAQQFGTRRPFPSAPNGSPEIPDFQQQQNIHTDRFDQDFSQPRHVRTQRNLANNDNSGFVQGQSSFRPLKLEPLQFNGNPKEWPTFWLSFQRTVHNSNIPNFEKHLHLLQSLEKNSSARKLIDAYQPSDANYKRVIEILHEEYGDAEALRESLLAELYHRPAAKNNLASLRSLSEDIERICLQLSQLGIQDSGAYLRTIIRSKLPSEILLELVKDEANSMRRWDESDLRKGLRTIVRHREMVERAVKTLNPADDKKPKEQVMRSHNSSPVLTHTRVLQAVDVPQANQRQSNGRQGRFNRICSLCEQAGHNPSKCTKYTTPQQRREQIIKQKRCLKCLSPKHYANECQSQRNCWICGANSHHGIICNESNDNSKGQSSSNTGNKQSAKKTGESNSGITHAKMNVIADNNGSNKDTDKDTRFNQTVEQQDSAIGSTTYTGKAQAVTATAHLMARTVWVAPADQPEKTTPVVLFFDPGSQTSYIARSLVEKLNPASAGTDRLQVEVFGGNRFGFQSDIYNIRLQNADGSWEEVKLNCIDKIGSEMQLAELDDDGCEPGMKSIQYSVKTVTGTPEILLGIRQFWLFFISRKKVASGLFVIQTTLGPVLGGETMVPTQSQKTFSMMAIHPSNVDQMPPSNAVEEFFKIETIGIKDDPSQDDDQVAYQHFNASVKQQEDGRYSVTFPWRDPHPELLSNFRLAYSRLSGNLNRLRTVPEHLHQYQSVIEEQLKLGIIELAEGRPGTREHFIPHQAVITPKKLRVVYDASAHGKGRASLNDCLYRGPVLLPNLAGLINRFRCCKVPVLADIEKAFLMISVDPVDREVCKFLWVKDPAQPITTENLVVYRFTRVAFGIVSSPFILAAVVRHHLQKFGPGPAEQMIENMYVDNLLIECEETEEAIKIAHLAKELFSKAKMNLREFISSDPSVAESFPLEDRLPPEKAKVLGVHWQTNVDELIIKFPFMLTCSTVSRRIVLQILAKLFDPLGLVAPALLAIKLFFQQLWDENHGWDIDLGIEETKLWAQLMEGWHGQEIRIPRYCLICDWQVLELHVFTDASVNAFATALYLRSQGPSGCTTNLIFSKCRLKPRKSSKTLTIPRLELLGVLLGVRAKAFIVKELHRQIASIHLWSDSKIVLSWIQSLEPQPQFVDRRLREIRAHTDVTFNFVRSEQNPADLATRGASVQQLQNNRQWWNGPEFLSLEPEHWPNEMQFKMETTNLQEHADQLVLSELETCTFAVATKEEPPILSANQFHTFDKLLYTITWIMHLAKCIRRQKKRIPLAKNPFNADELFEAKNLLIRLEQKQIEKLAFPTIKDENDLIRMQSHLGKSNETHDFNFPIILPAHSFLAKLIIRKIHVDQKHGSINGTLTEFLSTYWMPQARRVVKSTLAGCLRCRRMTAPKFRLPDMPPLPQDRIQARICWNSIGIDYLGPAMCRLPGLQRTKKVWIVLITCLTTRAVYLDATLDLSSTAFINVLRRFIARRGSPVKIMSDNAPHFIATNKALNALADPGTSSNLRTFVASKGITWHFIPALSPFAGGLYEKLVDLTKRCIQRTLGQSILPFDHLITFLAEVEAGLNSRPLTYVADGPDSWIPLRPIDFVQPKAILSFATSGEDFDPDDPKLLPHEKLAAYWQGMQEAAEICISRWRKEYLLMLREMSRVSWAHKNPRYTTNRCPVVGEVVLVEETYQPRNIWPLGRVVELNGHSPNIRSVQLKMGNKRIITRPISKIYPLEIAPEPTAQQGQNPADEPDKQTEASDNGHGMMTRGRARTQGIILAPSVLLCLFIWMASFLTGLSGQQNGPENILIPTECSMNCTTRGVNVTVPLTISKFELCCMGTCWIHLVEQMAIVFELSNEILVNDWSCNGTFWQDSSTVFQTGITCPARDQCELINCFICWDQITNPTCNPQLTMSLLAISLSIVLGIIGCLWSAFTRIRLGVFLIYKSLAFVIGIPIHLFNWITGRNINNPNAVMVEARIRMGRRRVQNHIRQARNELQNIRRERALRLQHFGFLMALLFICFPCAGICSETVAIVSKSESCRRSRHGLKCTVESATTITLLPNKQSNHLLIRDEQGVALGLLTIQTQNVKMECIAKSEAWMRSYRVQTVSSKRCPRAGSCTGNFCGNVKPETHIPELRDANQYPGNSFCTESSSFWHNSCALPSSSCLFYRWHVQQIDHKPYQILSCTAWDMQVIISVKLEVNGKQTLQKEVTLHPGISNKIWPNITVTALAISMPPLPILNSFFLTDGEFAATLDQIPHDLHCADEEAARDFNCTLALSACQTCSINHDDGDVQCHCQDMNLRKLLLDPLAALPLTMARTNLKNNGPSIYAETGFAPVQIHTEMKGLELILRFEDSKCWIEPQELVGCYHCSTGAQFTFMCHTDFGKTLANVACADGTNFPAHCDLNGTTQKIVLPFRQSQIETECRVDCPAGVTHFSLRGQLHFIPLKRQHGFQTKSSEKFLAESTQQWQWPDFNFDLGGIFQLMGKLQFIAIFCLCLIFGYVLIKLCLLMSPLNRMYRLLVIFLLICQLADASEQKPWKTKAQNEGDNHWTPIILIFGTILLLTIVFWWHSPRRAQQNRYVLPLYHPSGWWTVALLLAQLSTPIFGHGLTKTNLTRSQHQQIHQPEQCFLYTNVFAFTTTALLAITVGLLGFLAGRCRRHKAKQNLEEMPTELSSITCWHPARSCSRHNQTQNVAYSTTPNQIIPKQLTNELRHEYDTPTPIGRHGSRQSWLSPVIVLFGFMHQCSAHQSANQGQTNMQIWLANNFWLFLVISLVILSVITCLGYLSECRMVRVSNQYKSVPVSNHYKSVRVSNGPSVESSECRI